ncbi:hypothetical protein Tco_1367219, partial [Tanacetum coccineum]
SRAKSTVSRGTNPMTSSFGGIREPDSGRLQPLPEVQGKGKEKVIEEQAAHDLLNLQTLKKKSPAD